jgi:NADP-dependent 3-hydroxy acid dehydrogenase YdfG
VGVNGKVAAITGASSGIGEATAVALARAGLAVALGARREDRLREVAERVESEGGRALALVCDVTDEEQAQTFVKSTREQLGRLDVLVNNAGLMLPGPVYGADTADWRRMIDVNLLGLLYCTHAAFPVMAEQGGGHIVNLSSVAGRRAALGTAVYNMTKFGVNGFSEGLRQEALHSNVRVTMIEPGYVDTELTDHMTNPLAKEGAQRMRDEIGEVLKPEQIADAIVFAVSQPEHVSVNEVLVRPTKQRT